MSRCRAPRPDAQPSPARLAVVAAARHRCETSRPPLIAAGVLMLMQPFSLTLYGYSFVTTLVGTVMFTVVSKFPE